MLEKYDFFFGIAATGTLSKRYRSRLETLRWSIQTFRGKSLIWTNPWDSVGMDICSLYREKDAEGLGRKLLLTLRRS